MRWEAKRRLGSTRLTTAAFCAAALEDKLDLTIELCHFACYLLSRLHGVFLIRETKTKAVKATVVVAPETRRKIPLSRDRATLLAL